MGPYQQNWLAQQAPALIPVVVWVAGAAVVAVRGRTPRHLGAALTLAALAVVASVLGGLEVARVLNGDLPADVGWDRVILDVIGWLGLASFVVFAGSRGRAALSWRSALAVPLLAAGVIGIVPIIVIVGRGLLEAPRPRTRLLAAGIAAFALWGAMDGWWRLDVWGWLAGVGGWSDDVTSIVLAALTWAVYGVGWGLVTAWALPGTRSREAVVELVSLPELTRSTSS